MKILWVATKAPWPPVDGGRLLLLNTLRALSSAGHQLTLVAPTVADDDVEEIEAELGAWCHPSLVPVRRRALWVDAGRAQLIAQPLTIIRHTFPTVRLRVAEHLQGEDYDLVQAEQVQALSSIRDGPPAGLAVVLRAQNVESDLWAQSAHLGSWRRPLLALEARRLAAWEGRAVARCTATLALTTEDARRLGQLAGDAGAVHHVPAPFELELPGASSPLAGSPAVVLFGSGGWRPNAAGASWFLSEVWPKMLSAQPDAVLHIFGTGTGGPRVVNHPAPEDSRDAYPPGSVLVVPLEIASGVRIKILEAWARGVPVIATPQAARGLAAEDGEQLLLARDGGEFAAALTRLADPVTASALVDNGRRHLRQHHDFPRVAERLEAIYDSLKRASAPSSGATG